MTRKQQNLLLNEQRNIPIGTLNRKYIMQNRLGNKLKKMKNDSLKVSQNEDGSFSLEWDKKDPNWKWLNDLTSKEIQVIIEQAIKYDNERRV